MKEEYKKWGIRLLVVLFIIVVFTGIDYAVHSLSEDYAVP